MISFGAAQVGLNLICIYIYIYIYIHISISISVYLSIYLSIYLSKILNLIHWSYWFLTSLKASPYTIIFSSITIYSFMKGSHLFISLAAGGWKGFSTYSKAYLIFQFCYSLSLVYWCLLCTVALHWCDLMRCYWVFTSKSSLKIVLLILFNK